MKPANKLSVEWVILPDGRPALAFDKPTWLIYEKAAAARRQTAQQMITASVAAAIGPILVDHYSHASDLRPPIDKNAIRAKLVELTRLAAAHGIDIEALIYEALDVADVDPS